jgi:hypothetical protein
MNLELNATELDTLIGIVGETLDYLNQWEDSDTTRDTVFSIYQKLVIGDK